MLKPFNPKPGGTIIIANAISAAAAVNLDDGNDQFVVYNSSATAIAFLRVEQVDTAATAISAAATTTIEMPIPPGAQIRLTFGLGFKRASAIASAADGNLYITAGHGN